MEIRVGRFLLKSDKFCCYIDEEYEDDNGKLQTRKVAGYCTSFHRLLEDFIDKQVKDDEDITSLKKALLKIADATDNAKAIAKAAYKGDFKIVRNSK